MSNRFAAKDAWLGRMRKRHAASQIVYRRGNDSVTLSAHRVAVPVEVSTGPGVTTIIERIDWTIEAVDLVLFGQQTRPEEHDRIEWRRRGVLETYEVMAVGTEAHYQEAGTGTAWIVHSKLVKRVE